ncbi:PAS-domain containing protein, partial [Zoogloea sp.]
MTSRLAIPTGTPGTRPGTPEELRRYDLLLAGFDLLDQAIAVFDATPKLVTWNKALLRLLDFPEDMVRVGTPFEAFVRFNVKRGEYGGSARSDAEVERLVAERMAAVRAFQPHNAERTRPNGQVLSIRGVPIPNLGFVTLWTDVTEQRRYEQLIESQNADLETRVRARTAELEAATTRLDNVAAQLARSEERLRLIMDAIPALIAYVDAG